MKSNSQTAYAGLVDFHTHILPRMDDGSSSVDMSLQMIDTLSQQGVSYIVLTPHFYPSRDYPEHFTAKRQKRYEEIVGAVRGDAPVIIPGAEIQYFDGITAMSDLPKLRIGKSAALLVEMPFGKWTDRMVSDVIALNKRKGYRVVLAHIDRYLKFQSKAVIEKLVREGVLMQANADFFSGVFTRRKALRMLDAGFIHLIGSDSHNMTSRPPSVLRAYKIIGNKLGEDAVHKIKNCAVKLLFSDVSDMDLAPVDFVEI